MDDLVFTPTRTQTKELYTSKDLHDCKHVFIRNDAVKNPLRPIYSGPFQVVERHLKYFKLTIKDKLWYCLHRQTKTGVLRLTNKEKYDRTLYNYNKYYIVQTIFHANKYTCKHHHKIWKKCTLA